MKLSYIIVTHNRREPLLRTLRILHEKTALPPWEWEVWVVDNGSTDGTLEAVQQAFPDVHLICCATNEGVWSRSHAFEPARGEHVILLDDDSHPMGDAAPRSIAYLQSHPKCAAVVGLVVLPDGSYEACAFPSVMLSGAVCIRRSVLLEVGGFRPEFFRKAGEYDLSFRIWNAGYSVERFEDIVYRHDKVATGRSAAFAHRMDLRNNLILVERYLPSRLRSVYRADWSQRYSALARHAGHGSTARFAKLEAACWRVHEAACGRTILSPQSVETIFQLEAQSRSIAAWANRHDLKSVVIAEFSKNLFATFDACRRAGLKVIAIADNHPAFAGMEYRGAPIENDTTALAARPGGVIISNVNPAQIDAVSMRFARSFEGPVLRLWEPRVMHALRLAA